MKVKKPCGSHTTLRMRVLTQEREFMTVVNVGNPSLNSHALFNIGKITQQKNPSECNGSEKAIKKSHFTQNQRLNTREKNFEGGKCEKSSCEKSKLTQNQSVHKGKKTYTCNKCGKSFH